MQKNVYGYIRVSSKDQNEDRQRIAMREFESQIKIFFWISKVEKTLTGRLTADWSGN